MRLIDYTVWGNDSDGLSPFDDIDQCEFDRVLDLFITCAEPNAEIFPEAGPDLDLRSLHERGD